MFGHVLDLGCGPHVEADDDGLRGRSQQNVGFCNGAGAAVHHVDAHFFGALLEQGFGDGFQAALNVGLEHEVEGQGLLIGLALGQEGFQSHARFRGKVAFTLLDGARVGDAAGQLFVADHKEFLAGFRHAFKALYFHRQRGAGVLDLLALIAHEGAHTAGEGAAHEVVALAQGTFLNKHGGHRAASLVQLGFHNVAAGKLVGIGLEFHNFGLQSHHFQQFVQTHAGLGRHLGNDGVAAPFFGLEAQFGQLAQDAVRVCPRLVHLVDGHHDGHVGGTRVVDGLAGLLHNAVVGGHHKDDEVRHLSAAGAHGRKGFMAGRVEKDDFATLGFHVVSADVLGDAASFAAGDVGLADGVKQRGFAVVHVAHDGHHGRARLEGFGSVHVLGGQVVVFREAHLFHFIAKFGSDQGGRVKVQGLVDGGHDAKAKENLDDLVGFETHLVGHVGHTDGFRDADFALGGLERLRGRGRHGLAALATTLATAQTHAVVIVTANGITLLKINGTTALEALFLALTIAAVRGGRGRGLLAESAAGRTWAARASGAGAARASRTGAARASRAGSARTRGPAGIVAAGAAGAGAARAGISGAASGACAHGTRGAFLLAAGSGP